MSAVLLAIFNDYATADHVRMALFDEGFPTDRYELTACCEPGRAAFHTCESQHGQFVKYFRTLLSGRALREPAGRRSRGDHGTSQGPGGDPAGDADSLPGRARGDGRA
jgi:hypothetical protein